MSSSPTCRATPIASVSSRRDSRSRCRLKPATDRPFVVRERLQKPQRPTIEDTWSVSAASGGINDPFLLYGSVRVSRTDRRSESQAGLGRRAPCLDPRTGIRLDPATALPSSHVRAKQRPEPSSSGPTIRPGISVRHVEDNLLAGGDRDFYSDGNRRTNLRWGPSRPATLSAAGPGSRSGIEWLDFQPTSEGALDSEEFRALLIARKSR